MVRQSAVCLVCRSRSTSLQGYSVQRGELRVFMCSGCARREPGEDAVFARLLARLNRRRRPRLRVVR